jgi:hypothetical protein
MDPRGTQLDRLADHKHAIRRAFHAQLKHLWQVHPTLKSLTSNGEIFGKKGGGSRPLAEVAAEVHPQMNGFRFVPLVCEEYKLLCRLDLLLLRRDKPGNVLQASDLDNRLKVIFDALKMPAKPNELGDNKPQDGEDPLFVLLQEDSLVSHVSVETDELLDPPPESGEDDRYVRLFVKVSLSPYFVSWFNMSFGSAAI